MPAITSSGARQELAGGGSSAPVLEFLCLYTHDLQRKQKRWQDGRLKYHTFNKRVMVYDDRGNSVGDMHWHRDWEFDEGEEIKLDRGGAIVQVQERVGRQNQDLTDLLDKRAKEKEERQSRTAARMGLRTPAVPSRVYPAQNIGPGSYHRRLDQVLSPTGHHGRAVVPTESPFEQRQRDQETPNGKNEAPAPKRRKYNDTPPSKLGYAQSLFGAPLTLSAVPMSSAPFRRPAVSAIRMHSEPASSQEEGPQANEPSEREAPSSKRRKRDHTPPRKMGYAQSLVDEELETCQSTSRNRSAAGEDDDEGPSTRLTRKRTTEAVAEESDSDELPQVSVGPRLARLRKSVKSREVIGFVPSSSPVMEGVTIAEPQLPPVPAPLPPPLSTLNFMDTVPSLDISDNNSPTNVTDLKATASPPLPPLKSATDKVSAVRRDISHPITTSKGAPVNKSPPDSVPVHLDQSISESPNGEPPHHHVTSASGAERAGKSAITHQQTMISVDTTSTPLPMLSEKGRNLVTRLVEGEVHEHSIAVPRDVGVSSVASNNPNGQTFEAPPAANNPRPKIANPATRGRKAALKSHAAGQVPQSIVPVEPAPGRLVVMRPPETTRPEAAAGGRPKYKMQLPGFTSARETARDAAVDIGPWSREAHDLFGNGRPSS
ncbi:protein ZGRF1 [Triangularia verruculosa]|uniref:Protein ZGRF1 n=1 Tax=Triangularia verruculosa TaxID=2587418 RepID=A0AAN6XKG4_9PEZI|nr:protein ZGRF1 [Triangularia verruculosa]